ncbi:hypothetical protein BLA29_011633, partial [Euroglyphus maynei]
MQHYATILCALALMVSLNLSLLIWLLSKLNLALENDTQLTKSSGDLHLIGSVSINGQLAVQHLSSPRDSSELRVQSDDLELRPHYGSSSPAELVVTGNSIQAKVGDMITVRSSYNDRLLLLIDSQTPGTKSKLFVDQVVINSTPTLQNRAISMKNGSAQVLQLQS